MAAIIETKNLTKTYLQGKIKVNALMDIDLKIEEGEYIAILGPSGSGKSTLMNILGALDTPSEGEVWISGKNIRNMNSNQLAMLRQNIGFVFQYFNLIPRLTAFKNVLLAAQIQAKRSNKECTHIANNALKLVGLEERIHHKPNELSGGQQQRVAIARALAQTPTFLLMDEPTGNVDTKTRDNIMEIIEDLNHNHKKTIILITHDLEIAQRAKRIIKIVDGRIISDTKKEGC